MTPVSPSVDPVDLFVAKAFAPMHKRALGLAVGLSAALVIFGLTAFHVILRPADALSIELLAQYFYGYTVTWPGAFVGAWWAFVAGFVAGWFAAFMRNLAVGLWLMVVRVRANLGETRDFLDHI